MFGMAVLALASCSKSSDVYDPTASKDRAQYEQAFINAFGVPASNQDWGFGTSSYTRATTATRAAAEFGWELSEDYIMEFDKSYQDACLRELPEGVNAQDKLTNYEFLSTGPFQFSIIYTQTSANDKVGYYYYNPATQTAADATKVIFVEDIQQMSNYLQWSYAQTWDGVDYWTVDQAGITGANVKDVWTWGRGQSKSKMKAKVFTFNIPAGYRVGFFVVNGSHTMYSNKSLNADGKYYSAVVNLEDKFLVGLEDWHSSAPNADFDCNDVIMSINKTATTTPPTIVEDPNEPSDDDDEEFKADVRIMAEDLNASEKSDFDFNDVVFDVQWIDGGAKIRIMAAGGTYPLRINGEDALEVHGLFEVSTKTMVNTFAGKKTSYDPVIKTITGNFINSTTNENDASLIKVEVNKGTGYIELTAPTGKVASKICVDPKVDWCDEYLDIDEKWSGKFTEYVGGKISQFWN